MHARLEAIDEEGLWKEDESFTVGDTTTTRKKGQKAKNIMASWRKLRAQEPALFSQMTVWQSPTAFVDGVIWGWQQSEESSRFESLLRMVDSLATSWSPDSQQRNWLSQCVQAAVPPGCTPLVQLTDTAFSMPAKARAREVHEYQRRMLMLKAQQEGVPLVFKVVPREM